MGYRLLHAVPGGHRVYSCDQLDQLRFVKAKVASGMAAADAHRLLAERLAEGSLSFSESEAGRTKLLVLLAEHDPYAADLSEYFLRTEDFEVALALDAVDAIAKFDELNPNLSVIGLLLSGGGGLELCRKAQAAQ